MLLLSEADRNAGGDQAHLVDRALTTELRERPSERYSAAVYPVAAIKAAYSNSGLTGQDFDPLTYPDHMYPPARVAAFGRALGTDYVAYMVWPKFSMPLLADGFSMSADTNIRVAINVVSTKSGQAIGTKIVTIKSTSAAPDKPFLKAMRAAGTDKKALPGAIARYLAAKVFPELQNLPIK
ncbi:hypothetical protein EON77_01045 [bacterium]|nr:MAG: hypothetical protein EON77_01045 [bacterium]